ncbi:MAG TPA: SPASM domain-containing protein [Acidimicrobiales bacterium]|nr:SPASM domain-containing protein [Acidimicrobiales bacterium]
MARRARGLPVKVRSAARRLRPVEVPARPDSACYAPSVLLYFQPDGDVRACCRNQSYPLGNVRDSRLLDIWNGPRRRELVARLAADDYSHGCEGCRWEIDTEGRDGSYPQSFEAKATHLTVDPDTWAWPRFLEFNLSNSCNLQCIQCNGDLSSSIRLHREHRPPLPKVYGDEFFDDLTHFLPHLDVVQFAGGEPFMASENYRAWELIAEVAPDLEVQVVTNATQWNKRVEAILEKVRIAPTFSIYGITAETYESVRQGADHDAVLTNIDRFCAYAERVGTRPTINFCLMAQNFHEFGPLLLFAERRGIPVNVSVVHYPEECAIARLDPARIAEIHAHLVAEEPKVLPQLALNARTWSIEVARIGSWLEGHDPGTDHTALWGVVDQGPFGFPRWADRGHDAEAAREALEEFAPGAVHHLEVGPGEVITGTSPGAAAALGVEESDLVQFPVSVLQEVVERAHGVLVDQRLLAEGDDRVEVLSTFGDVEVRTAIVALRDDTGYTSTARLLFALRALAPTR